MVGERMRLAVPRHSYWTAFGALVWGFPHSGEGGVEKEKEEEEEGGVDKCRGW